MIDDVAERLHPVEDPSEHWSDSLYFNAWDPGTGAFLMTRIAVLANAGRRTGGVLAWLDGEPSYAYGREVDGPPESDWDVMAVGGLTYRMHEARRSWVVELADPGGEAKAYLTWEGFTGCVDYADNAEPLPRAVAWGHYEQTCRVTGDLIVGDRRVRFDGLGQRDHSWGYRDWAGLQEWHWVTGFLGDDRSFNLFHVVQPDGTVTVNGFVHDAGVDLLLESVVRETDEAEGRTPTAYRLVLTTVGGGVFEVTGRAAGTDVPVRPSEGDTVVHEVPMSLTGDGRTGFGIYELLENTRG